MILNENNFLVSPLLNSLGISHGFTTRLGGVSTGNFSSFNLHKNVGESLSTVEANWQILAKKAAFSLSRLCQVFQVHGNKVVYLEQPEIDQHEADGMMTRHSLTLSIKMADCVPILITDNRGTVAALHAGWRGTLSNIIKNCIDLFKLHGSSPSQLYAAIGPSIGPCCFVVTKEVADLFKHSLPSTVSQIDTDLYKVNLWQANAFWLLQAGIPSSKIDAFPPCTACHPHLFYSHRRDKGQTGRHLAFITGGKN